jgi:hypothetical protein
MESGLQQKIEVNIGFNRFEKSQAKYRSRIYEV